MPYRTANYSAFYVNEPFSESNLTKFATKDFVYYNQLKAWKAADCSFPFIDAHAKTYNVRDNSDWETTLKPRLHERLKVSKNILLFLSNITKSSQALREEIDYGINKLGLPIIVIYPKFSELTDIVESNGIRKQIKDLWNNLPVFRDCKSKVATLHIPYKKDLITLALRDQDLMVQTMTSAGEYYFKP